MAEAQAAIDGASGTLLLDQTIHCDYAFVRPPPSGPKKGRPAQGRSASSSILLTQHSIFCNLEGLDLSTVF